MSKHDLTIGATLSAGRSRALKRSGLMLSAAVLAIALHNPAFAQVAPGALPTGGNVVGGAASIDSSLPSTMNITQGTDRAVINWNSFDIGSGATVNFVQPSSTSIAVNRVVSGTAPSEIAGHLNANGRVAILNANGVTFSGSANVDVGGLIASTGQINDANFMAGGSNLEITGANGGEIVVTAGASIATVGLAALVGPTVRNSGTITATAGKVQLGGGTAFTLDLAGDGLLAIGVGATSPLVTNNGSLFATGGRVQLSARQAATYVSDLIPTNIVQVGSATIQGDTIVLNAVGGDIGVDANATMNGAVTATANRISGAGDLNVTGTLTANVNAGAVADTTAANWIGETLGVIGAVTGGTTINLGAGIYAAGATINHNDVALVGAQGATINVGINQYGLTISADNVSVSGLNIRGPVSGDDYRLVNWDSAGSSTGIHLTTGSSNASILDNGISNIRTGVLVDGPGNDGSLISGNYIESTKGAILVQYTDGTNFGIANNREGTFGNEWGIVVNLNAPGLSSPQHATTAAQANIMSLSTGNSGMTVMDRLYAWSNRSHVTVDANSTATAANDFGYGNGLGNDRQPLPTIQAGVIAVAAGGTVNVGAGTYTGNVTINKAGISLLGAGRDTTTINGVSNIGALGAVTLAAGSSGTILSGFTINGIDNGSAGIENAAVYIQGNNTGSTIQGNRILAAGDYGIVSESGHAVTGLTVDGNIIGGKTYVGAVPATGDQFAVPNVSRQLVALGGGGVGGGVNFTNNVVNGDSGLNTGVTIDSAGSVITGNTFATTTGGTGASLRVRGAGSTISGNIFNTANLGATADALFITAPVIGAGDFAALLAANTINGKGAWATASTSGNHSLTMSVHKAVAEAATGATVNVRNGTYDFGTSQLALTRAVNLVGESQAGVIFDGRAVSANGLGTIHIDADNTSVSGFTLYGSEVTGGQYGIKIQPTPNSYAAAQRISNVAVSDVTVRGSRGAEIDINGAVGVTITNVIADGRRVIDNTETAGVGVQVTDSSNVTLTGVHTLGNAWGGVALNQTNRVGSGYDAQTTNININAADSSFAEALGLFTQDESATKDFGQLNLSGFNYAVRNTDHRPDNLDSQFVFFRTSLADATNFATNVGTPSASSIEGYTGTAFTNTFTVSSGLSINAATRDARTGGTINVGAGTYNETVAITRGLTLAGAGMDATSITGGIKLDGTINGLTLENFTVSGNAHNNRIISNQNVINNLTVDGVRIDGQNSSVLNGFVGGQIGGDISITNSEFVNIRAFQAFDTGSSVAPNAITSAVFSNNLLDNTVGSVGFRPASNITVDITDNFVTNVGSVSTPNISAVFKVFGGGATVNFLRNQVSDVGITSPLSTPAYGSVLMVRDASLLNVTGNTFTNNNQVFAVESGRSLPTVTNFTGNTFTNNGVSIFLPTNLVGSGTISFGAGNNFVAGADTVQHIVWRSAAGLDLTNVSFDGVLASELSGNALFAVENLITHGVDVAGPGLARVVAGQLFVTPGTDNALRAVALASAGDTLNLSAGTHVLSNTLFLQKSLNVLGQGQGATIIDASGYSAWGIRVQADNSTLGGFTLLGSPSAANNTTYGIKIEAGTGNVLNDNFAISNVTISGSRRTGLDLNSVVGAVIDGVTVTGVTNGNGIAITDSTDVTVRNTTTSGNAWGGLALYQTNNLSGGGSVLQLSNVTIEASNSFGEANGLYLQDSSALLDPGGLNIRGFDFTVRNAAYGDEYTFFRTAVQDALDYAINLSPALSDSSVVQGWNGTGDSGQFVVGFGSLNAGGIKALSIQAAFDASSAGDSIYIGSGIYDQTASLNGARALTFSEVTVNGLALAGAGTILGGTLTSTGDIGFANDVALSDATSLAAGGNLSLAGVTGNYGLTLSGNAVTLGSANVASLAATGATIASNGATTSGAQIYTGATTLNGAYAATGFGVTGATTLGGDVGITADSVTLGTAGGAHALTVDATGAVSLGAASGLASLTATGATIATNGATTSGAQIYTGTTTLNGDYDAASFAVSGAALLGGDTSVTGASITLGQVGGAHGLTVNGGAVSLGAAQGLTALDVTGSTIATNGAITNGAQHYAGATTLNGLYATSGGDFEIAGAATLGGATTVGTSGGNASFGTVGGSNSLAVNAGAGSVSLGTVSGLTSLSATGASIATNGASTAGVQSYAGATILSGAYSATDLSVAGAATLGGDTGITADSASLGTVGGAHALTIDASGAVSLGAASGLTSLTATGASIATNGATTSGAQSYTGATSLNGAYSATGFGVTGAATLAGDTSITGTGVSLGTIGGAHGLTVNASGAASLGAATGLTSLAVTGASVTTNGATTSGAQSYTGATTLGGAYSASGFGVTGATTLGSDTGITAGSVSLGTVGGAHALSIDSSGAVSLGAASGLTSLTASGATIATNGASTAGAQSYTGATTLAGVYSAAGLSVAGAATLGSDVGITGGSVSLGPVGGTHALTVNATGAASIGTATGLTSLSATGASIATNGATTSGAQSYTGATSLNGAYAASGFAVNGAATLAGATGISTANGAISLGSVDGAQALSLDAGTGTATLGAFGANTQLGTLSVTAGQAVLNAPAYSAASISFAGGANATVRLTQAATAFTTSRIGGGGAISIQPQLIGTAAGVQNVVFAAGSGLLASDGDVAIGNAGSDALRLGTMTVNGRNFTAQTVKLAGNFTSTLSGAQTFSANTLDTLGSVRATVLGNESGPIRAGGAVTIQANGSGAGSVIAGGPVTLSYGSDVSRAITSTGAVSVAANGAIGGSVAGTQVSLQGGSGAISTIVNATGPVTVGTTSGAVGGSITTTGPVTITTTSGGIASTVNSGGAATVSSGSGTVGGSIMSATGPVSITTSSGAIVSTVNSGGATTVVSNTGGVNGNITGTGPISVDTGGAIGGTFSTAGAITLTSDRSVNVQVSGSVVTLNAPGGVITGVFSEISTNDAGTFLINNEPVIGTGLSDARQIIIDSFIVPVGGTVGANGEIQLPVGLALGLIAPAGRGEGQRPPVVVNSVARLGELLRVGYTAIIIQIDDSNVDHEEELVAAAE